MTPTRASRAGLLWVALLIPSAAAAQTQIPDFEATFAEVGEFTLDDERFQSATNRTINIEDCHAYSGFEMDIKVTWTLPEYSSVIAKLDTTGQTCNSNVDEETTCFTIDTEEFDESSWSVRVNMNQLMFGDTAVDCDAPKEDDVAVRFITQGTTSDLTVYESAVDVRLDFEPPGAPELTSASGGDGRRHLQGLLDHRNPRRHEPGQRQE